MSKLLTADELRFTPPSFSEDEISSFLESNWGVTGTLRPLAGERDQNMDVGTDDGGRFVLKITSYLEDRPLVDFQVKALQHLETVDPDFPAPKVVLSCSGRPCEVVHDAMGREHFVRLLTYVPGVALGSLPVPTLDTVWATGALQGRLCRALEHFAHPADAHFMPWDTMNGLLQSSELVQDHIPGHLEKDCAQLLTRWELHTLPALKEEPAQVIHNDAHSGNIMCRPDKPEQLTGLIDFGDMVRRPLVVDLSTSLASLIERDPRNAFSVTRALLNGFMTYVDLPIVQRELLLDAVLARSLLTVQLLSFRITHTQTNRSFRETEFPQSVGGLETLLGLDRQQFLEVARQAGQSSMEPI